MPSPVTPADIKTMIAGTSSLLCDKFTALLQMPYKMYLLWAYLFNEDGSISNAFKADICALGCVGGGTGTTPNPNMPAPTGVSASDGTYSDKIRVTWNSVTPPTGITAPTEYKIYRAPSTTTNPNDAVLVGTVASTDPNTFDDNVDGDLSVGTTYNYWVRASNGVDVSGFSASDVGNAATVATTLTAVSDLACTKGFSETNDGYVGLVWTPTGGATKWDIYRNTVNDPNTATKIAADQIPVSTGTFGLPTDRFWDNDGELLFEDSPPNPTTIYYYWVVGKKDAPPAQSPKSNVDTGWLIESVSPYINGNLRIGRNEVWTVPASITAVRVVLFGGGAGGAGGGIVYGAGGGGGGGIAIGEIAVVAGGKLRVVSSPDAENTSNAAAQTNGDAGFVVKLQYSAAGTFGDTVDKITTVAPGGGLYSGSGAGAGGSGGGASVSGVTNSSIIPGRAGGAGNGGNGGKSGYLFGSRRLPMSNRLGSNTPVNGVVGSGSKNSGSGPTLLDYKGGSGSTGWCVIAY